MPAVCDGQRGSPDALLPAEWVRLLVALTLASSGVSAPAPLPRVLLPLSHMPSLLTARHRARPRAPRSLPLRGALAADARFILGVLGTQSAPD